jgi:hypothetical protein
VLIYFQKQFGARKGDIDLSKGHHHFRWKIIFENVTLQFIMGHFITQKFNFKLSSSCCRTWNSQSQMSLTNELWLSIHCHLLSQSRKSTFDPQFISNTVTGKNCRRRI